MRRSWHSVGQASRLSCGWNGERVLQLRLERLPGGASFPRDRWVGSPRVPQFQVTTGDGCPTPRPRLLTSDFCLPGEHRTPNTGHRMGVDACAPSLRSHFIGSHLGVESFVLGRLGVGRCPRAETSKVEGRTDEPKNGTNDRTAARGCVFPARPVGGSPASPPVPGDNRGRLSYSSPATSDF